MLYERSRHCRYFRDEAHHARLRTTMNAERNSLVDHPTQDRIAMTGRPIGGNRR